MNSRVFPIIILGVFFLVSGIAWADLEPIGPWGAEGDFPVAGDFNSDGIPGEIGVFRPSTQTWYFDTNLDGRTDLRLNGFGESTDYPLVGDFDRDGFRDDLAVYSPYTGTWTYHDGIEEDGESRVVYDWGVLGDIPLAGDFNNNGYFDDVAVFRPTNQKWYFDYFADGTTDREGGPWGAVGDVPSNNAANIDEPKTGSNNDIALYRANSPDWKWFISYGGDVDKTDYRFVFGDGGGLVTSGDFDNDGYSDDFVLFRPSERMWYFVTGISAPAF